jgi:hypothetical protein
MDEVHFQQYGSRCRMWIPPEVKDPVLQHHPTRKSVGYFGAVRLRDGKFIFARELNRFDAMTTWNFLRLLRRRSLNSKRRAIVITDNAKYHHAKLHSAWRQKNEGHFRLDYLPPYSPDLNPIERVWKLTRKRSQSRTTQMSCRISPPCAEGSNPLRSEQNRRYRYRSVSITKHGFLLSDSRLAPRKRPNSKAMLNLGS